MRLAPLALLEIRQRWFAAGLFALAVAAATAFAVVFARLLRSAEDQTRVIQRDMGLNLLILPRGTDLARYHARGHAELSMPDAYLERVSGQQVANRLVPLLKQPLEIEGAELMLTGIGAETFKAGTAMGPVFGRAVEPGTLVAGAGAARALDWRSGSQVEVAGETFELAAVLAPAGTREDIALFADLNDAQRVLGLEGRINEIQALECFCDASVRDPLALLEAELGPLLDGAQVVRREANAEARRQQRLLAAGFVQIGVPLLAALAGIVIGSLAMLNVRERRGELGILRALGFGPAQVAAVILWRAVLLGALGSLAGVLCGQALIRTAGPRIFPAHPGAIRTEVSVCVVAVGLAVLLAAATSLVPALIAARQDPAKVLRDD